MKRTLIDKIKSSAWIISSFFIFINGLGFIYIGRQMENPKWILEGVAYEIPWLVAILGILNYTIAIPAFVLGLFLMMIGIVRSIMVNYQYQELLDEAFETFPHVESGASGVGKQIKDGNFTEKKPSHSEESKAKHNPFDLSGIDRNYDGRIKFEGYKTEINELSKEFAQKNANVKELVEKRFADSRLTYDRFMSIINESENLFNSQASYALDMIDLTPEYTDKIDEELQKKIEILRSIIKKTDELRDELVINMTNETGSDVKMSNLFDDMMNLTKSVKDYE